MEKKPKKKEELISAAALLFQQKGFKASSVRDLAEAVNIEASSIYSHFKSKEDLLVQICQSCEQIFTSHMSEIAIQVISPKEKIASLIRLHLHVALDYASAATVFSDEWKHLPEPYLSSFLKSRKSYENEFSKILSSWLLDQQRSDDAITLVKTIISATSWLSHTKQRDINKSVLTKEMFQHLSRLIGI